MIGDLTSTEISLILAGAVTFVCYVTFLVAPAWASYGRVWEKVAASVLTLFMLASLLMVGIVLGAAVVLTYDRWA